jgi:hypothetical protein
MPRYNARYLLGTRVLARAIHVASFSECHRRYGSNAKMKQLYAGTAVSVDSVQPASNKRAVTLITAEYERGGTIKR